MPIAKQLRRQHDAALAMSNRLFDLIDNYAVGHDAYAIAMQLTRLVGLLRIHLAQEEVKIYPSLTSSEDPEVAKLARTFIEQMGGLATELEIFAQHWSCSATIAAAFDEFREDAQTLLMALAVRIECEDRYLYPLADAAAAAAERRAA